MKPASDQICPQISDCSRGLKMDPSRSPFVQPGLTSMDAQHATGELYRWWPLPVDQIVVVASFAVASAGWKYSPLWTKFHQLTSKWQMLRAVFYGCDLQTRDIPIIPFICLFCTPMHITPVTCTPQYKIWTKIDCTSSENAFPIPLFFHLYNNICKLTQGCTNQPHGCIHVSQFLLGLSLGPGRMFEEISRSLLVGIVSTWVTSMSI